MSTTDGFDEFVAIVEAGNISAAARALGMPRANLSRRLAALEDELGVRLLHRSTRRQVPTDAGQELYRRVRRIVDDAQAAREAVRRMDDQPRGLLRVSVPPGLGATPFAGILVDFLERWPEVRLELSSGTAHVDLIAEGFDLALRAGRVRDHNLVGRQLFQVRTVAVASPAWLSAHGVPTSLEQLRDAECIRGFDQGATPQRTWPLLDGGTVPVRGRLATNELRLVLDAALRGLGIALLPQQVVDAHLASGALVRVLPDRVGDDTALTLVYPEREFLDPKVRAFIDFVVPRLLELLPRQLGALPAADP